MAGPGFVLGEMSKDGLRLLSLLPPWQAWAARLSMAGKGGASPPLAVWQTGERQLSSTARAGSFFFFFFGLFLVFVVWGFFLQKGKKKIPDHLKWAVPCQLPSAGVGSWTGRSDAGGCRWGTEHLLCWVTLPAQGFIPEHEVQNSSHPVRIY